MSDTFEFVDSSLPSRQRSYVRQRVLFSCIQLEDDNGGIILDASEGGLAIQTVRSLDGHEFLQMRFQFSQYRNWIEAQGRIAWVSASTKIAGIEFIELSDEAREEIRAWIALTAKASGPDAAKLVNPPTTPIRRPPVAAKLASSELPDAQSIRQNRDAQAGQRKSDKNIALKKDCLVAVCAREAGKETRSDIPRSVSAVQPSTASFAKHIAVALVVLALVVLMAFSLKYKQKLSPSLFRLAHQEHTHFDLHLLRSISLESMIKMFRETVISHVETELPETPAPVDKPQPRNSVAPAAASPLPDDRSSESAGAKPVVAGKNPQLQPLESPAAHEIAKPAEKLADAAEAVRRHSDKGQAELELALQSLGKSGAPQDGANASQLLWSAVQKGNGEAEVHLAGLYLRGQGIPKNCEQGRILLEAARVKQLVNTAQERSQLSQSGCN